jgi:hypothetical protein
MGMRRAHLLGTTDFIEPLVSDSLQALLAHSRSLVALLPDKSRKTRGKVLVNLESHRHNSI